jgi:formate dehydrogenase subunit beta
MKGAIAETGAGERVIVDLLLKLIEEGFFDAVLIPVKIPSNDTFAYVLAQDKSLIKGSTPLPPVMGTQGAKAVSRLTRLEKGNLKIAAVMRPCEIRATIELAKLGQLDLENITLVSMDCPGALPLSDFLGDPGKGTEKFENSVRKWEDEAIRDICKICEHQSTHAGDIHIGTLGAKEGTVFIIPKSQKGTEFLEALGMNAGESLDAWESKANEITARRQNKKKEVLEALGARSHGIDGLLDIFSHCINCHNCMRVCPICYCQLCFFESDAVNHPSDDYMQRARNSGSLRFPPDVLLFHVGRMLHMSLSCVSCGACEDACPMSIPVAQMFSLASRDTQALFEYVSGRNQEEPVPLVTFNEKELQELGE